MELVADEILDTSGLLCPEPVMMLHGKIRDMTAGDIVEVIATDPSTTRDIPKFCTFLQHQLLHSEQGVKDYRYFIKKC